MYFRTCLRVVSFQFYMYQGLGHGLYEEAPDFLQRIRDFCGVFARVNDHADGLIKRHHFPLRSVVKIVSSFLLTFLIMSSILIVEDEVGGLHES